MKGATTVSLLALGLGAGALVTALLKSPDAPARKAAPALPAAAPNADLLARLEALREENGELRDRLALLEIRAADAQRTPLVDDPVSRAEFDAFRDQVLTALESGSALAVRNPSTAVFEEQVATTLSQIRKTEAVGKARAKQEARLARLDETMPKIEEWLDLSAYQSTEMRTALLAQYDRDAELIRRWEAGEDTELLGEQKAADRQAHRDELAAFLTAEQLETYTNRSGGK